LRFDELIGGRAAEIEAAETPCLVVDVVVVMDGRGVERA